jgi:hypothetical protein
VVPEADSCLPEANQLTAHSESFVASLSASFVAFVNNHFCAVNFCMTEYHPNRHRNGLGMSRQMKTAMAVHVPESLLHLINSLLKIYKYISNESEL